jgi:hypothetical protein
MGGLIKDFALTALIIFLTHWVYGIEDTIAYEFIVSFIVKSQAFFITAGILGSSLLLLSSTMFESFGFYKITYGLSKILARTSQFLINFLTIINIIFYAALGNNLMQDKGYGLLFSFALILGSSCWTLRIIDFNHPIKNVVIPVSTFALLSVILVQFVWPFFL